MPAAGGSPRGSTARTGPARPQRRGRGSRPLLPGLPLAGPGGAGGGQEGGGAPAEGGAARPLAASLPPSLPAGPGRLPLPGPGRPARGRGSWLGGGGGHTHKMVAAPRSEPARAPCGRCPFPTYLPLGTCWPPCLRSAPSSSSCRRRRAGLGEEGAAPAAPPPRVAPTRRHPFPARAREAAQGRGGRFRSRPVGKGLMNAPLPGPSRPFGSPLGPGRRWGGPALSPRHALCRPRPALCVPPRAG